MLLFTASAVADSVYFYHTDPAGTPIAMSDASGNVVWRADYRPFGEIQSESGTAENNKLFVGKEKDDETGLYYFGARYMDDRIGRFISPDPVGPVDPRTGKINEKLLLNPQRLNTYAYALNNPYRYIDPDGNTVWDVLDFAFFAQSVYQFANEPSWSNAGEVGLDAVGLLPGVPSYGLIKTGIKTVGKGLIKADDAYEIAKAGGKNSGLLKNYLNRPVQEIEDAVKSYEKNVEIHREKIANPETFAPGWGNRSKEEQEGLLRKWQKDLTRNQQQGDVMKGLLKERKGGLP